MKTRNLWILAALATAGLTACGNDDEPADKNDFPQDGVVRFSVGVNDTRAAHADVSTITEFGIIIDNAAAPAYTYNNIRVAKNADGEWAPERQMLWQNASQPVDIVAYTHYNAEATCTIQTTDMPVAVEAEQSADTYLSDFLICRKAGFVPGTSLTQGKLDIAFTHALSRLTVQVAFGTELNAAGPLAENPIGSLQVSGTVLTGTCDLTKSSDFVSASTADAAAVTPYPTAFTPAATATSNAVATYECILVPQTVAAGNFAIAFTIGNVLYEWKSADAVTLAENTHYELAITAGKDYIVINSVQVNPWNDKTVEGGEAEEVPLKVGDDYTYTNASGTDFDCIVVSLTDDNSAVVVCKTPQPAAANLDAAKEAAASNGGRIITFSEFAKLDGFGIITSMIWYYCDDFNAKMCRKDREGRIMNSTVANENLQYYIAFDVTK